MITSKKGYIEDEFINDNENDSKISNQNKLPYSAIAAYDGLILDQNDMKIIYKELKNLKVNINRKNMDNIKNILITKLNLKLPKTRKYQLEHLTLPYSNDQIFSPQEEDEMKQNFMILQYYIDILCYGYSIYLTKWQCSSWFNIFITTHKKFIEYINNNRNLSTYRSQCLNIFKNELFYFCNPRTVILHLKENENNNNNENNEDSDLNHDNLEEILLSNRYIKPGIFDSILPSPQLDSSKKEISNSNSSSLNKSHSNNISKKCNSTNSKNNSFDINKNSHCNIYTENIINSVCSSKSKIIDDNINSSYNSIISNEKDNIDYNDDSEEKNEEEDNLNEDCYIFEYNLPMTFNSLQIECLTRFFLKTYVQHINIIAYVFSKPQERVCTHYKKAIVSPVVFEELENGIIAEEWPNWVQEQENIIIKKKEEEEAAIEREKKKKEEELLKEQERLNEELAKQKLLEKQENIIKTLNEILYQPSDKNISDLPFIPLVKSLSSDENNHDINVSHEVNLNGNKDEKELFDEDKESEKDDDDDDFTKKKFNITNPRFRNSFLELWKKQIIDREQQEKDLLYQLNFELQRKNDVYAFDISEQSLSKLENSRHELIKKIKEITGEDESKKLRYVYDPEKVESIIQNSELLKDQYFVQLQKHVEEVITKNVQYITERIDNVNAELEKLRSNNEEKNNPPNKKGVNKKDEKNTSANNSKTSNTKEDTKKKEKSKKK